MLQLARYGQVVEISQGVLEDKIKMRSRRYKGRGRPLASDYDYKTILQLQDEFNNVMNRKINQVMISMWGQMKGTHSLKGLDEKTNQDRTLRV